MKKINVGDIVSKTGNFIGNNKRPLLYIGGATILAVVAVAVVKKVNKQIKGTNPLTGKLITQSVDQSKLSITGEQARNYAESLYSAFNYYWGTDKAIIATVFSKINSEDFKLIYNNFGIRSRDFDGKAPTGIWKLLGQYDNLNLVEWLNEELGFLDGTLKNKIRPIVDGAGFILEK